MELLIPIALILVGLALVAVEVTVVPGFNVVGVAGAVGAAVGVVYAFVELGVSGGLATLAATLLAAGALGYLLWDSGAWDRFILSDSLRRDADADAEEYAGRARMLGQTGRALTPLRPGGVAEVGGERLEVETEGTFVAAGSRLRVVALDRRRVIVRVAEEDAPRRAEPASRAE